MVNAITSGDTLSVEQLKNHSKIYAGPIVAQLSRQKSKIFIMN